MQGLDERTRELIQRRVLKRVKEIPSLPQFVVETLKKLDDPKSNAADVSDRLSRDEGLVIRILRLANSAYYGLPRRIVSVTEAIALLGFKTVKSIVLSASVYQFMDGAFTGYALDRGQLWKHSLSVAFVARHIAKKVKGEEEEAYVAGMLHDLGKIVLNDFVRFGYGIIVRLVEDEQMPFMDAETQILGFNHSQVGGMMLEQWNLPETYQYAARFHHNPEECQDVPPHIRRMVDVVHVANAVCLMMGLGIGADGLQYTLSEAAMERLRMDSVEVLMSEVVDFISQVDEEFRLGD